MKILMCDIDGVLIPKTQYLIDKLCTYHRTFPATTIAVLNEMCFKTDAKIVLNTTHNQTWKGIPDIKRCVITVSKQSISILPTTGLCILDWTATRLSKSGCLVIWRSAKTICVWTMSYALNLITWS